MYPTPASTPDTEETNYSLQLIIQLNALLRSLKIPLILTSPTDLTPSLLIAILESLINAKIPPMSLDDDTPGGGGKSGRLSQTHRPDHSIQSIKMFLGILEHDVLGTDAGLSSVDPRRLAEGEWDEVVFVGELLCWVGRQAGLLMTENIDELIMENDRMARSPAASATTGTTKATNSNTTLSSFRSQQAESITSINTEMLATSSSTPNESFSYLPTFPSSPSSSERRRPRCIHEVPSPSLLLSVDLDVSFSSPQRKSYYEVFEDDRSVEQPTTPPSKTAGVRYSGYIEPVDEDTEIASFESSRSFPLSRSREERERDSLAYEKSKQKALAARYEMEYNRTLKLLDERARLLNELAELKNKQT